MSDKKPAAVLAAMFAAAAAAAGVDANDITISRNGSRPSVKAPAEYFTGTVRVDPIFKSPLEPHASGSCVTFEPAARSAWHTHPRGQTLVVTSGTGRIQRWGGPIEEIRPGDVVWIPPGQKHWHGAA